MSDTEIATALDGFLISRDWRETPSGLCFDLWVATTKGPARIVITDQRAICFVDHDQPLAPGNYERKRLALANLSGRPVDGLYFKRQTDLFGFRRASGEKGIQLFESDVKPVDRYLMERFISGPLTISGEGRRFERHMEFANPRLERGSEVPALTAVSLDIETDFEDQTLFSIGVAGEQKEIVFLRRGPTAMEPSLHRRDRSNSYEVVVCDSEAELLEAFFQWMRSEDPDLVIGWNVVNFDLTFLANRCEALNLAFRIGRGDECAIVLRPDQAHSLRIAKIPGRAVLDGIDNLRAGFWSFDNYTLSNVARELLGKDKLITEGPDKPREIRRLFLDDPAKLVEYNLNDCRLVREIFAATDLQDFCVRRAQITGLALGRQGGSVAAFDFLYLPRLHRRGFVAPDADLAGKIETAGAGGYVLDSRPGLYQNVVLLDFKSLYPSIIRSFLIDPLGLAQPGENPVAGIEGATFSTDAPILPEIISELWPLREAAKQQGNRALSQAIKIIMNSFYGVLGATGCRFRDIRLTNSITRRGHEIILRSKRFIEDRGFEVIYGDTDSIFVHLGPEFPGPEATRVGEQLSDALNRWWKKTLEKELGISSFLEVEFEEIFKRFLMPTIRGSEAGTKKRYAGLSDSGTLLIRGLEAIRSDWTPYAREFQRELLERVLNDEPYEAFIREARARLNSGSVDAQLIYRKRIRRRLDDYQRNVPPHVRAARKLKSPRRSIEYVITTHGPEPIENGPFSLDYEHYQEKQLKPATDSILHAIGGSFDDIAGRQLRLL